MEQPSKGLGGWSRFAVKENFRGLPAVTTEVIVDHDSWIRFRIGESYLLTAETWKDYGPLGWSWDRLRWWWQVKRHWPPGLRVRTWGCLYSWAHFRVPEEDWADARAIRAGTQRRWMYGRVSIGAANWPVRHYWPPLAGATVHMHGRSKSWVAKTDRNGDYAREDVEPGEYSVNAQAPGSRSTGGIPKFAVRTHGCGYGPVAMSAAERIAGHLVRSDGTPNQFGGCTTTA